MPDQEITVLCEAVEDDRTAFSAVLEYIRPRLRDESDPTVISDIAAALDAIDPKQVPVRLRLLLTLYKSLAHWRLDGSFTKPFTNLTMVRLQMGELERFCQHREYQAVFLKAAAKAHPSEGTRIAVRITECLPPVADDAIEFRNDPREDVSILRRPGATHTIVGFSGRNHMMAGIGWNMFDRAVTQPLNANLIVLRDFKTRLYLSGIASIGDRSTTIAFLREMLAEFSDTKITFLGGSGGVFGALHAASELDIAHVVAVSGPTSLALGVENEARQIYKIIAAEAEAGLIKVPELTDLVNASAISRIDFFVAGKHVFDFAQMRNLADACPCVVPRVYENSKKHVIIDHLIADGSLIDSFRHALTSQEDAGAQ